MSRAGAFRFSAPSGTENTVETFQIGNRVRHMPISSTITTLEFRNPFAIEFTDFAGSV